jgi:pseudoazurin
MLLNDHQTSISRGRSISMKRSSVTSIFAALVLWAAAMTVSAQETHQVNAEARVFNPDILYIQPGDSVQWQNMTSHDSVSIEGLIPEGAQPWRGAIGENLSVTLTVEGVYAYVCEPHIGFGMMGVVVVGKPVNIDAAMAYAQEKLQGPFRRIIGKLLKVQQAAKA